MNLVVTFRHGNPSSENVREAPGRILKSGEIVPQIDTGKVLICQEHDITATSNEWAGSKPDGCGNFETVNPSYDANGSSATVIAYRGTPVYLLLADTGLAYQPDKLTANYNPYNLIVFANAAGTVALGTVAGKDLLETDGVFQFTHTNTRPTVVGGVMS